MCKIAHMLWKMLKGVQKVQELAQYEKIVQNVQKCA